MIKKDKILELCQTALSEQQFVVDVKINSSNDIFVYIDDFNGLNIEECKRISRFIESNLDRENEDFSLEVGSPGLSKPFKVEQQYKKAINSEIEIIFNDGEKQDGVLNQFDENTITITQTKTIKNKKKQIVKEQKIIERNNIKYITNLISLNKKNNK